MIDWHETYTTVWRLTKVDTDTWADGETIDNVESAKVTRTADGALLEAGSIEITTDDFEPGYYRLSCTAIGSNGASERVDVCTMLYNGSAKTYNYDTALSTINGRSVLYPASVNLLLEGEYAPANVDGAAFVAEMLRRCVAAPIEVETAFTLNENVVFEFGSSILEAAWLVLDAGSCVMQIDGTGTIHIRPQPETPVLELGATNARLIAPAIKAEYDLSEVPNQYIAMDEFSMSVATNDNPDSPTSIQNRGYVQMELDDSPIPVDGETLERYAQRKLRELSTVRDSRTYTREYWPGVLPYDVVRGSLSSVGLSGDMRVITQSLTCKDGISVSEKAAKEVELWRN